MARSTWTSKRRPWRCVTGSAVQNFRKLEIQLSFDLPLKDGQMYVTRTHPMVESLSTYVLETALDPLSKYEESPARRCGVIRTGAVQKRTTLMLIRMRYHIVTTQAGRENPLLAEDCQVLAFSGSPQNAEWLDQSEAEALLQAAPDANIAPEQAAEFIRRVVEGFDALSPAPGKRGDPARTGIAASPPARAPGFEDPQCALPGGTATTAGCARDLYLSAERILKNDNSREP